VHVSVSVGPVTPNLAVATVGFVTDREADADAPPYDPVTVPAIVPPTSRVETMNVAVAEPAGTVTLGGTVSGSALDSVTTAPLAGAVVVRVAVPVTESPPTTLAALSEIDESAAAGVTVSAGVWPVLPLREAVIVTVPTAIPVTVNVALDAPT
jgi:hypothetical protein